MTLRFYMHQPTIIFEARVDQPIAPTYPFQDVKFDNVTTGAFGDIKPGMTVLFGSVAGDDNYGRNRVRAAATSDTLKIGRSSIGTHDGEVLVVNNSYITVLDDYRIWAKVPHIIEDGTMYKDGDLVVGTNTTTPPPVANAGPPAAGTIDSVTLELQVMLPPYTPNRSFAVADSATISSYAWVLPASGVTLEAPSVLTDSQITVNCDPGFYWIELTVTDSNAKTHTTRTFIYARDPAADDTIGAAEITEHRITRHGQTLGVRVTQAIAEADYPDGTIAVLMDGEPESLATRRNVLFWGWHQTDPATLQATREAGLTNTTMKFVDIGGRLDTLPGFTQAVYNDAKREDANPAITWAYMTTPHWDKLLHYVLHWHSTALELTDWQDTGVGATFPFTVREAGGASLFDQVNTQCESLCPAHYFTCDRQGLLACPVDPMLQDLPDRTGTVQANIPISNWTKISYTHQRAPRAHWLDDSAVVASATVVAAIFSHAPGDSPGQGESRQTHGEQIAPDQDTLNKVTGHRYARMNAPESPFNIQLTQSLDVLIDPAKMEWTTVDISAAVAAERGLTLTTTRGLVSEMTVRYEQTREAVERTLNFLWERETAGSPAVTVIPPDIPPASDYEPIPTPEESNDGFFGDPQAYIIWDNDHIGRTDDILASPPTWELVDTGISGTIIDCQYISRPNGTETVGLWCLSSAGVFWCADIFATTPAWSNTLSLATMQAAETAPDVGDARFASMFNHGARPGYLIVGTEPDTATDTNNINWPHAYFHFTDDYGATWTVQDSADELTRTTGGGTSGYCYHHKYAINWYRDTGGRIYALRHTPRRIVSVETIIMYSDDDGATWIKGAVIPHASNSWGNGSLLNPFPGATDPLLVIAGPTGVSTRPPMYVSTDNGETVGSGITPTGMGGFQQFSRLNSRSTEPNHIIGIGRQVGSPYNWSVVASGNAGSTWSELFDTGVTSPAIETPNGWPPDGDTWFTIRYSTGGAAVIWVTDDYFATGLGTDKTGNLITVFTDWSSAIGGNAGVGGIAMPRLGANA